MKKAQFMQLLKEKLDEEGYDKIHIKTKTFALRAEVDCRDHKGRKCHFTADVAEKHGKEQVRIKRDDLGDFTDFLILMDMMDI